jgi:hypothetical protein
MLHALAIIISFQVLIFSYPARYKPETKQDKAKRLKDVAASVAAGKKADAGKKVHCFSC